MNVPKVYRLRHQPSPLSQPAMMMRRPAVHSPHPFCPHPQATSPDHGFFFFSPNSGFLFTRSPRRDKLFNFLIGNIISSMHLYSQLKKKKKYTVKQRNYVVQHLEYLLQNSILTLHLLKDKKPSDISFLKTKGHSALLGEFNLLLRNRKYVLSFKTIILHNSLQLAPIKKNYLNPVSDGAHLYQGKKTGNKGFVVYLVARYGFIVTIILYSARH